MALPYPNPTNTGEWAHDLLSELGAPQTPSNVGYIEAWEHLESPSGFGYNPLGDETGAPGSIHAPGNSASVQAYQSWLSGLNTTAYNLTSLPQNAGIVTDLKSGDATLAELSAAQSQGGWKGGLEQEINRLGSSTPFTYGGASGIQQGAPGVATKPTDTPAPAAGHTLLSTIFTLGGHLPGGGVISKVPDSPSTIASSIISPLTSWIEQGAADVTFVGFGLLLVTIGLIVTFKSGGGDPINLQSVAPTAPNETSSSSGGVKETGGAVKDVAVDAAAA